MPELIVTKREQYRAAVLYVAALSFITAFVAIMAIPEVSAQQSLVKGANDISITEAMVGKTVEDFQGDCKDSIIAAFVFNAGKQGHAGFSPVYIFGDPPFTQPITGGMVGKAIRVLSTNECIFQTSHPERLGLQSKLLSGFNFISVSKGMVGESFADLPLKGTCTVEKVRLYSPKTCENVRKDSPGAEAAAAICSNDYLIIGASEKLPETYLGKGLWVKVASDCILDDTPPQALCSEAECAAKNGCYGNDYVTYGCKDNSCAEISRPRACTAAEKAKQGVDLVPRAEIKPLTASSLAQMEAGDEVEIAAYIGNEGSRSTTEHAIEKQQLSYTGKITIEKTSADGKTAVPVATEYKAVSMVDKDIPSQGEAKVMSFVWKPAEEGSYRVKIDVDINKEVTEAGEAGELNNEKTYELVVKPAGTIMPDLVVEEGKISLVPKVLCRPATVSTITATVKNIGRTPAAAQGQFLGAQAYVKEKEGGTVVCSSLSMRNPPVFLVTISPGQEFTFTNLELTDALGNACVLQPGKEYVTAVDVDTLSAVTESNENNMFSASIVDETRCEEAATRQGTCYCDFDKKPKTQKKAFEQCSHNFECKTELCIKNKCVTEAQKEQILRIVG